MKRRKCIFFVIMETLSLCAVIICYKKEIILFAINQDLENKESYVYVVSEIFSENCMIEVLDKDNIRGITSENDGENAINGHEYYADGLVLRKYPYSIELQVDDIVILELSKLENMRECSIVLVDFNNKTVEELSIDTSGIIQYK